MNERIKELMAEADRKCSETHGIYDEILAELIIVKCANIIWDEADKKDNAEINEGGYKILDHFGIDWKAEQTKETFGVDQ